MKTSFLHIEQSPALHGTVPLVGAKNAVLVIMASLVLTRGKSRLKNVPASADVLQMIRLLEELGASVTFFKDEHELEVDTTGVDRWQVSPDIMKKMRASVLVMGALLARFGRADIAMPGGCLIGDRPINYHLSNFEKMGVIVEQSGEFLCARVSKNMAARRLVLAYPSVGATENIMMAATAIAGTTRIVNAALEPEVLDLVAVLQKMGAHIAILPHGTIEITGGADLKPIVHSVIMDRLEAGALLLAGAITGGNVYLPDAPAYALDVFLLKLEEMGHTIEVGAHEVGIRLIATNSPRAVSFKTGPYPSFPTDLQAPMFALQCLADGESVIEETVFENRLLHARELSKMGAQVTVEGNKAVIKGVEELYGTQVIATDIRASCALVLAGLAARGSTIVTGVHHWKRGYDSLEQKLRALGGYVVLHEDEQLNGELVQQEQEKALQK